MSEFAVSSDEAYEAYDEAISRVTDGTLYPAMTYEEGVRDALGWVLGENSENPMKDE